MACTLGVTIPRGNERDVPQTHRCGPRFAHEHSVCTAGAAHGLESASATAVATPLVRGRERHEPHLATLTCHNGAPMAMARRSDGIGANNPAVTQTDVEGLVSGSP